MTDDRRRGVVLEFPAKRTSRACRSCGLPLRFHPETHQFCKRCWALTRLRHAVTEFSRSEQQPQLELPEGNHKWRR